MLMNKIIPPKIQMSQFQNFFSFLRIERDEIKDLPQDLDLKSFQEVFNTQMNTYLDTKLASYKKYADNEIMFEAINYTVSLARSSGKRIRPYITYVSYCDEGGMNQEDIMYAGIALELLHTFALIHDDIIDKGDERHGKLSAHKYLEKYLSDFPRGDKTHISEGMAMLAGDLILSWSHEVIAHLNNPKVQGIFSRMIEELVAGQLLDVSFMLQYEVDSETITKKNELKTALYSFVNPMLIGSALSRSARTHKSSHGDFCRKLGLHIGQAYQIQDDLLDIIGDPNKTGKKNFLDIKDGQHTILSQYIFENGRPQDKKVFMSLFGKDINNHESKVLLRLFKDSGAITFAEDEITALFQEAEQIISTSEMRESTKKIWNDLIGLLDKRKS